MRAKASVTIFESEQGMNGSLGNRIEILREA
jgi:hypothetical protein